MADDIPNILKCRDDKAPVFLSTINGVAGEVAMQLAIDSDCSWLSKDESVTPDKLRSRIEPWLTALFQSEHLSLLVGSGLTHATHRMAVEQGLPGMNAVQFATYNSEIDAEVTRSAEAAGRAKGNIEDQLRVAIELLRGLEILNAVGTEKTKVVGLATDVSNILDEFAKSILKGENSLANSDPQKRENTLNYLVSFLMSFASRAGTRDRLHIFTTNYDRYIEIGSEAAGLHLLDRFIGSLAPIFRSSRLEIDMHYNPPGIRGEPRYLEGVARFTKLHGSVDWVDTDRNIRRLGIPFGALSISPYLNASGLQGIKPSQLMVYPNSAKDRETASYPYVELFRDFAAAVCRPNSTLVCFGYSFGDEHINRVVEDMLTIPSTHLVVISYNDPLDRIMQTYEKLGRPAQVTLLIGDHFGDLRSLVDSYLPKPAIDRTMFRMGDILRSRWGNANPETPGPTGADAGTDGGPP